MSSMKFFLGTALVLICFSVTAEFPAVAEMYRWTDGDGVIRFSDTPPSKQKTVADFERLPTEASPRLAPHPVMLNGQTRSTYIEIPESPAEVERRRKHCENDYYDALRIMDAAEEAENNGDYDKASEIYSEARGELGHLSNEKGCDYAELAYYKSEECDEKINACHDTMNRLAEGECTAKWNGMIGCLSRHDTDGAIEYMHPDRRAKYVKIFSCLKSDELYASLIEFRFAEAHFNSSYGEAQGEVVSLENGKKYCYPVDFEMDRNGEWWICDF